MNLYQINAEIEQLENACEDGMLIDEETGELITFDEALRQLRMAKEEKIENVALWVKNLTAESAAIYAEEESLAKRRKATDAKCERLKAYLISALMREDGSAERFKSARCTVTVRSNPVKVTITDEKKLPAEFFAETITRRADKVQIKEVLSRGIDIPGAVLERTRSVMIK